MHEGEEVLRVHVVARLQAAQGGAVHFEIRFAQGRRVLFGDAQPFGHVQVDARLDGLPQTAGVGVEGIVEIEEEGGKSHRAIIPVRARRGTGCKTGLCSG